MKLNASNCHLLTVNSIKGFLKTLSKFYLLCLVSIFRIPILENTYWWLLLLVLNSLVFRNISEWMLSSLSSGTIFYSEHSYLKNHPNNTYLHSHFHEEREFDHCFSSLLFIIGFLHYFLRRHSSKTFLHWRNIKILIFFKAILSMLNITNIKLIYIKSSFGFRFE